MACDSRDCNHMPNTVRLILQYYNRLDAYARQTSSKEIDSSSCDMIVLVFFWHFFTTTTSPVRAPFSTRHNWFLPVGFAGFKCVAGMMWCWIPEPLLWPVTVTHTSPGQATPALLLKRSRHIVQTIHLCREALLYCLYSELTVKPKW